MAIASNQKSAAICCYDLISGDESMGKNEYGTNLLLAATAFALDISQELNANEINVLGNFLSAVGSLLSLMAAAQEEFMPDKNTTDHKK